MIYKIKNEEVIIFPTDTVYGMGCKLSDSIALEKIFEIKKRDMNKKISVLISSLDQISDFIKINDSFIKLSKNFWPGALTIIVELKKELKYYDKTIGVRIPNCEVVLDLLKKNGPLATTSVNISGEKELDTFEEIVNVYADKIEHIFEKKDKSSSISSTVILLKENNQVDILREGTIKKEEILFVLSEKNK